MTLDKLETRHAKEREAYWKERAEREKALSHYQEEIISHCYLKTPKAEQLLKALLDEQHAARQEWEKEELDMLLHIQNLEMEDFLAKDEKYRKLTELLRGASDRPRDNGR